MSFANMANHVHARLNPGAYHYHQLTQEQVANDCVICMEPLRDGASAVVAHGNGGERHPIHLKCVKQLVAQNLNKCPDCRAPIQATSIHKLKEKAMRPIKLIVKYFNYALKEHEKQLPCSQCHQKLGNGWSVLAHQHADGTKEHPIHANCAANLAYQAIDHHKTPECPDCHAEFDSAEILTPKTETCGHAHSGPATSPTPLTSTSSASAKSTTWSKIKAFFKAFFAKIDSALHRTAAKISGIKFFKSNTSSTPRQTIL